MMILGAKAPNMSKELLRKLNIIFFSLYLLTIELSML